MTTTRIRAHPTQKQVNSPLKYAFIEYQPIEEQGLGMVQTRITASNQVLEKT